MLILSTLLHLFLLIFPVFLTYLNTYQSLIYKILSCSKLVKNCKQISQCVCVRPTKRETRFFVISLTASSGHEAKSSSSRDMVATNFSCKKKEEDRIDDKTCTIDTVSRQFWVYFERIFKYISYNWVKLFLISYNCSTKYSGSLMHPSTICNVLCTHLIKQQNTEMHLHFDKIFSSTFCSVYTRVRTTEANFAECVYFFFSVIFYLLSLY